MKLRQCMRTAALTCLFLCGACASGPAAPTAAPATAAPIAATDMPSPTPTLALTRTPLPTLTPTLVPQAMVTVGRVDLYKAPGDATSVGYLVAARPFTIVATEGEWAKIRETEAGQVTWELWIKQGGAYKPLNEAEFVTLEQVDGYDAPGGAQAGYITAGRQFTIIEAGDGFLHIQLQQGAQVWIKASGRAYGAVGVPTPPPPTPTTRPTPRPTMTPIPPSDGVYSIDGFRLQLTARLNPPEMAGVQMAPGEVGLIVEAKVLEGEPQKLIETPVWLTDDIHRPSYAYRPGLWPDRVVWPFVVRQDAAYWLLRLQGGSCIDITPFVR